MTAVYDSSPEGMQRYFDVTVEHLLQLRHRAVNEQGRCTYLDSSGMKCAVGVHIPAGHEAQHYEGSVEGLLSAFPDLEGVVAPLGDEGMVMALDLQNVHDDRSSWDHMGLSVLGRDALCDIARRYDINSDVLDGTPALVK
jgi:hypothetical protein